MLRLPCRSGWGRRRERERSRRADHELGTLLKVVATVALYILAGALLSVLVALACACFGGSGRYRLDTEGTKVALLWQDRFGDAGRYQEFLYADRIVGLGWEWTRMGAVAAGGNEAHLRGRVEAGWPAHALGGEYRIEGGEATLMGLLDTGRTAGAGPTLRERLLPFRPIGLGLLLDAIFYGAFLRIVHHGSVAVRRAYRRRRGWCARCGYDLRGGSGACPECGSAFESDST